MLSPLIRLFSAQPGDLRRALPLFSYLFLIIAALVVGKVARDALFLDRFQALQLPYVDMAIALIIGLVVAFYIRLGRQVSVTGLMGGSLLFFALNALGFWWLARWHQPAWLYPVLYIWVGILGVLAPTQAWTLANYVLTTRAAKRLFGLIGSGAILGGIFGGFFSNTLAKRFGTEGLLLVMALFFLACASLVPLIWRQREEIVSGAADQDPARHREGPRNLAESLRVVLGSPHLRATALVILLGSVVTTIAAWQFKALASQFILQKDELAAFFGAFYGYSGTLALLVQLLLTSWMLRRLGLVVALSILPVALLVGSLGLLIGGTLGMVIWLKGSDNVLRYSIDKSSVELLYLPVSSRQKVAVKSFIDTVLLRLGDGLGGVAVLIFAAWLHFSVPQLSVISILLLVAWLLAAWVAQRQYVATLSESIQKHRLDAEQAAAPILDRSTQAILLDSLQRGEVTEILYALDLLETAQERTVHPAVRDLIRHPSAQVRRRAIAILNLAGDRRALPQIEGMVEDEDLEVRTEALLYLAHHAHIDPLEVIRELGDLADFSVRSGMVAFLARPGQNQNVEAAQTLLGTMVREEGAKGQRTRLEAARLIGVLPDYFESQLQVLLQDPAPEVAGQAIRAVGDLRKQACIPQLLDFLGDPQGAAAARAALAQFGDVAVDPLRNQLLDPTVALAQRREIPGVLLRIGTPPAQRVLAESLLEGNPQLRHGLIVSLNQLHRQHPELALDPAVVETVLAAEIMGHYRSHQILSRLHRTAVDPETVQPALQTSMGQEMERIFRLLSLLYPTHDLHSAYVGAQSDKPRVRDDALELLDNILKPQMRDLLVPLLDRQVDGGERLRVADRLLGTQVETPEQALVTLLHTEDPWLMSCAAYTIGTLGLTSLEPELDACLEHADPLLRQSVRQAKRRLAEGLD